MNIDLLFPTLTGDLAKLPKADPAGSEGAGQEFEEMLVQQSEAQQGNSRPQKKAEEKETPEKPEQKSTQEEKTAEEGGQLAAALVTSQPVVPIAAFEEAQVTVSEDGTVILEPAIAEGIGQEQAAGVVETVEMQPEETVRQEQPVEAQFQQTAETVQEAPVEEQPKAEAEVTNVEPGAKETGRPEVTVQRSKEGDRPQDEDMDADAGQQSQPVFHDVKSAPVKVGDTRLTHLEPEPVEPQNAQQMAGVLSRAIQGGADLVRIQLNPANLGSVTIELTRDAAGAISIVMTPETARAADLLSSHTTNLMASLAQRGENVANVQVNMPENSENAGMMMNPDGHNGNAPENEEDGRKKKREDRTEGVNAADFLSQLRLGLIGRAE